MIDGDDSGTGEAEKPAVDYDRHAQMLHRAVTRVREGSAASVVFALCAEALYERSGGAIDAAPVDVEQVAAAVTGAFGDGGSPVRCLVAGRPLALGGRTPLEVIACGEAPLLLYTLAALQHGLGA